MNNQHLSVHQLACIISVHIGNKIKPKTIAHFFVTSILYQTKEMLNSKNSMTTSGLKIKMSSVNAFKKIYLN